MEPRKLSRTAKIQLLHDECDRRVRAMKTAADRLGKAADEADNALASGDSARIRAAQKKYDKALKTSQQLFAEAKEMILDMGPLADILTAGKMISEEQN